MYVHTFLILLSAHQCSRFSIFERLHWCDSPNENGIWSLEFSANQSAVSTLSLLTNRRIHAEVGFTQYSVVYSIFRNSHSELIAIRSAKRLASSHIRSWYGNNSLCFKSLAYPRILFRETGSTPVVVRSRNNFGFMDQRAAKCCRFCSPESYHRSSCVGFEGSICLYVSSDYVVIFTSIEVLKHRHEIRFGFLLLSSPWYSETRRHISDFVPEWLQNLEATSRPSTMHVPVSAKYECS